LSGLDLPAGEIGTVIFDQKGDAQGEA
jgi:hypothetical protein